MITVPVLCAPTTPPRFHPFPPRRSRTKRPTGPIFLNTQRRSGCDSLVDALSRAVFGCIITDRWGRCNEKAGPEQPDRPHPQLPDGAYRVRNGCQRVSGWAGFRRPEPFAIFTFSQDTPVNHLRPI